MDKICGLILVGSLLGGCSNPVLDACELSGVDNWRVTHEYCEDGFCWVCPPTNYMDLFWDQDWEGLGFQQTCERNHGIPRRYTWRVHRCNSEYTVLANCIIVRLGEMDAESPTGTCHADVCSSEETTLRICLDAVDSD